MNPETPAYQPLKKITGPIVMGGIL